MERAGQVAIEEDLSSIYCNLYSNLYHEDFSIAHITMLQCFTDHLSLRHYGYMTDNGWWLRLNDIRTWGEVSITALQAYWSYVTVEFRGRGQLYDSNVSIVRSRHTVRGMHVRRGDVNVLFVTFSPFKVVLTKANLCGRQWEILAWAVTCGRRALYTTLPYLYFCVLAHGSVRVGSACKEDVGS